MTSETYLDGGLDALELDSLRLPNSVLLHISNGTSVTVDTVSGLTLSLLGTEIRQHTDGALAGVLDEGSGNNLKSFSHSLVRPLLNTLNALSELVQSHGNGHLGSTTTW